MDENSRILIKWGTIMTNVNVNDIISLSVNNTKGSNMVSRLKRLYDDMKPNIPFEVLAKDACLAISFRPDRNSENFCVQTEYASIAKYGNKYEIRCTVDFNFTSDYDYHTPIIDLSDEIASEIDAFISDITDENVDIIYDKLNVFLKRITADIQSLEQYWPKSLTKSSM